VYRCACSEHPDGFKAHTLVIAGSRVLFSQVDAETKAAEAKIRSFE
jgi:hypothetical protein